MYFQARMNSVILGKLSLSINIFKIGLLAIVTSQSVVKSKECTYTCVSNVQSRVY